jgi:hypothetical protein
MYTIAIDGLIGVKGLRRIWETGLIPSCLDLTFSTKQSIDESLRDTPRTNNT